MSIRSNAFVLAVAAVVALTFGPVAEARGRRANSERVHSRTALTTSASVRVARLEVERRNLQHQSIRLELVGAPVGETLTVLVADDAGVLTPVGTMRLRGRSGRASWEVRTARGDALPFGVADVASLSGRAIEVQSATGEAIADGVMPTAAMATGISKKAKSLKQGLAVDASLTGVEARVEFRRGEHGRPDRFAIKVEGAASALALEAWVIGTDGTAVKLGDLVEESSGDDDGVEHAGGDDDGADDDATDDDGGTTGGTDDGGGTTAGVDDHGGSSGGHRGPGKSAHTSAGSEYEFDLDSTSVLPFGAASLADLAGLALEIRDAADGSVVASGLLPDTSAPGDESDDDDAAGTDDHGTDG